MSISTNLGFSLFFDFDGRGEGRVDSEDASPVGVAGSRGPKRERASAISFSGLAFRFIVAGLASPLFQSLAVWVGKLLAAS